jgi:hypothetical protein
LTDWSAYRDSGSLTDRAIRRLCSADNGHLSLTLTHSLPLSLLTFSYSLVGSLLAHHIRERTRLTIAKKISDIRSDTLTLAAMGTPTLSVTRF